MRGTPHAKCAPTGCTAQTGNYLGEKTPHAFDGILCLADKFPDALCFIFLWRDINAVMESIWRAALPNGFSGRQALQLKHYIGNEKLRQACDVLKSRFQLVHEVNYEESHVEYV